MPTLESLKLVHYGLDQLPTIRSTLVEVYAEVYANQLSASFFSVEQFEERLAAQASRPGWEAVVGYADGLPAGYAYGAPLRSGGSWWSNMLQPLPRDVTTEDGERTLALFELMVREPWRGTGAAHRIHEELLAGRAEERVTLLVEPTHPKVKALYERWGYEHVGDQQPFPDAPVYATMLRPLHAA